MDWLKRRLEELEITAKEDGMNYVQYSTKWLADRIKEPTNYFTSVKKTDIKVGKFYFFFYDLLGKSTKMEKYSPILLIDQKKVKNKIIYFGLSFNFIPIKIRILFFNTFLNYFEEIINKNAEKKSVNLELPLEIDLETMIKLLKQINFTYAIRLFESDKLDKVYAISLLDVDKYLSTNSLIFTGVDEKKLGQIWLSKLKKGDDRIENFEEYLKKIKSNTEEVMDKVKKTEVAKKELDEINKKLNLA